MVAAIDGGKWQLTAVSIGWRRATVGGGGGSGRWAGGSDRQVVADGGDRRAMTGSGDRWWRWQVMVGGERQLAVGKIILK